MTASLLANRRRVAPFGLEGGGAGALGKARLLRANGQTQELGPTAEVEVDVGDIFVIETPGGGGFGVASFLFPKVTVGFPVNYRAAWQIPSLKQDVATPDF
jgi:N-methylhydantoinase B/oxoprolinase/acetone carboxylase alpha subunit